MLQLLVMLMSGTILKVTVYIVLGSGDLSPGYVHDDVLKITLIFGAILWWYILISSAGIAVLLARGIVFRLKVVGHLQLCLLQAPASPSMFMEKS